MSKLERLKELQSQQLELIEVRKTKLVSMNATGAALAEEVNLLRDTQSMYEIVETYKRISSRLSSFSESVMGLYQCINDEHMTINKMIIEILSPEDD